MTQKSTVRVAFIDVGQGDTIVISVPETGEAVIVDCTDSEAVISYLEKYKIRFLRGLIITHLHLDHYKGAMSLINNVKSVLNISCERVLFYNDTDKVLKKMRNDEDGHSQDLINNKSRRSKDLLTEFIRWAQSNREKFNSLAIQPGGIALPLPDIIEFIHPWHIDISDLMKQGLNDTSGVFKVKGTCTSALLTGDLEPSGFKCVIKNHKNLQSDVLKFPHHGAWKNSDPKELLDAVNPSVVIISVGTEGSKYGHPNSHVLKALREYPRIRLLCTQVTEQCSEDIEKHYTKIVEKFKKYEVGTDSYFAEQKGCPCAGTIIIELGEILTVLQPDMEFHCNQIIKSHFSKPKCRLS